MMDSNYFVRKAFAGQYYDDTAEDYVDNFEYYITHDIVDRVGNTVEVDDKDYPIGNKSLREDAVVFGGSHEECENYISEMMKRGA